MSNLKIEPRPLDISPSEMMTFQVGKNGEKTFNVYLQRDLKKITMHAYDERKRKVLYNSSFEIKYVDKLQEYFEELRKIGFSDASCTNIADWILRIRGKSKLEIFKV